MKKLMKKGLVFYFTLNFIILSGLKYNNFNENASAESNSGYCLIESNSMKILKSENENARLAPASTTKILTALLVLEKVDPQDTFSIPAEAVGVEGSSIYLKEGEIWSVEDLLYGLMLRSGNDAAVALAIYVCGSTDNFVAYMNEFCKTHYLRNSHFVNPNGLYDEDHYTSAYDLAVIAALAYKKPLFVQIVGARSHDYKINGEYAGTFYNKNKLLSSYPGANGVKTGYTVKSGRCFVGAACRDGMQLISTSLGIYDTYGKCAELLDYGFENYKMRDVVGSFCMSAVLCADNSGYIDIACRDRFVYPISEYGAKYVVKDAHIDGVKVADGEVYLYRVPARGEPVAKLLVYDDNQLIFEGELCTI